jgi:prevent-host-death family protein
MGDQEMIVNIHEAKTNFSKLISKFLDGEEIVIAKNGKPVLQFAPVENTKQRSRPIGFFNCDIDMSTFDDPIEEMKEYE